MKQIIIPLKEKTGKEYNIEKVNHEFNLLDVIAYIANLVPANENDLRTFFDKLSHLSENEKISFLIKLIQNKKILKNL